MHYYGRRVFVYCYSEFSEHNNALFCVTNVDTANETQNRIPFLYEYMQTIELGKFWLLFFY